MEIVQNQVFEVVELRHNFTDEQMQELGKELSKMVQSHTELEAEKKNVVASYNDGLKGKMRIIKNISSKMNDGFEMLKVRCEVKENYPIHGQKTLIRQDTMEAIIMDMDEKDQNLFNQNQVKDAIEGFKFKGFEDAKVSIGFVNPRNSHEPWEEE